jgi:dihydrofolate synthase/folylpolyglutamate synthase
MRYQTLDQWLQWQERLHPSSIDLGLERVAQAWRRLRPEGLGCTVITVGGTNGKGSSVAMLDAILRAGGYRVGRYTSPHLLRYNERICIDGAEVDDAALCAAFQRVDDARGDISLTYFEFGTLAALDLFAAGRLDVALLEVGLGGRLDAVNIVDADAALVTGIARDHTDWLGEDLDGIAREKAGIFRSGRPAVIGQADAPAALEQSARGLGAAVRLAGRDFSIRRTEQGWDWQGAGITRHGLPLPGMRSARQLDNAAAVLAVLDSLAERLPLGQDAVRSGLREAMIPGRLQWLRLDDGPGELTLILDVAHNEQAAGNLARDLASIPCSGRTHCVFGCFADKDVVAMLRALKGAVDRWYPTSPGGGRALAANDLAKLLDAEGLSCAAPSPTPAAALALARERALPGERIVVTGSFLMVAAIMSDRGQTGL